MGKYVKKEKGFSRETLLRVVNDVKLKRMSLRQGAKELKVSVNFIRDRVTGKIALDGQVETRGRKTVLKPGEEIELANYLKVLAKWGFGFLRKELMIVVGEFCEANQRVTPFKKGVPGKDWYTGFSQRHDLKLGNTEQLEKCRLKNTANPYMVYPFYDMLEAEARALGILNKPENFWNLDEMGASKDPTKAKVVAGREQRNLFCTIQGSGKDNTTIMGCISASGTVLPPMFIFRAGNLWSSWKGQCDIPGTFYAAAERGFITSDIFYDYLLKFAAQVKVRPLILVFDGHVTHMTLRVVQLARRENISILKLPSHTTDVMQPLDRTCFGPLKIKLNESLIKWQRANQRQLSKSEFVDLVCSVWYEGLSPLNIIAGFRGCGIFPISRDKYPIKRLNPELLKQYLDEMEKKKLEQTITGSAETFETSTCLVPIEHEVVSTCSVPTNNLEVGFEVEVETSSAEDLPASEAPAGIISVQVPNAAALDTSLNLDPDFIILPDDNWQVSNAETGPELLSLSEDDLLSPPIDSEKNTLFHDLDCDNVRTEELDRTSEVARKVSRPSRALKRPLKLADEPQVSRPRHKTKSPGVRGNILTLQASGSSEIVLPGPSRNAQPNHSCVLSWPPAQSQNLSGFKETKTLSTSDTNNPITKSFESLLLKKIGSTKPSNETRRLIHAKAAVITSDEYTQKIEELTKKAREPKTKAKTKKPMGKKIVPKSAAKSLKDSHSNKENVAPPTEENEINENVGENDYALCKESNGENTICFIEKVMPNLEEAVGLRFVKISSESVSQAFKIDGPCVLKISAVVKNVGKPDIIPTPSGIHYVFEAL